MEAGKMNQFSDMLIMPHTNAVQHTIDDQTPVNLKNKSSFKDELEKKTNISKADEQNSIRNENDKVIHKEENNKRIEERSHNDKQQIKDQNNKEKSIEDQKNSQKKDSKNSNRKLDEQDINNREERNTDSRQKNTVKNRIEEIKEGIRKNEIIKNQIKEKINTKISSQKTETEKSPEKLLFKQDAIKGQGQKKPDIVKTEEFGKVIENRFKNIENMENISEQKTDQVNKTENETPQKEKVTILKNEPLKEGPLASNFNLNLEKEVASSEIKLDKTTNIRQLFEQYQEISDKILNKVGNVINHLSTKGGEAITIRLQPPELGKIQIELVMKENTVNAKINTENIAVKEIILTNLDQIKASIENNGFNINKLDVEIGGFKNFLSKESKNFTNEKNGKKNQNRNGSDFNNSAEVINKPLNPYTFFVGRSVNVLV